MRNSYENLVGKCFISSSLFQEHATIHLVGCGIKKKLIVVYRSIFLSWMSVLLSLPFWNLSQNFDNNIECPFLFSGAFEFFSADFYRGTERVKLCVEYLYRRLSMAHNCARLFATLSDYSQFLTHHDTPSWCCSPPSSFPWSAMILSSFPDAVHGWIGEWAMDSCRRRNRSR